MAHKKAGGVTRLGRDSASQRLGVKISDGQYAKSGNIIIRQRGTKYIAGLNVRRGKDDTLFSVVSGIVKYKSKKKMCFDGNSKKVSEVSVVAGTPVAKTKKASKITSKK